MHVKPTNASREGPASARTSEAYLNQKCCHRNRYRNSTNQGFKESKVDEDTRQQSLDHVGFLFAYIADKDIFHKYYSKLLSKRIIQLTSVSDEAEERMLKNMRKVCVRVLIEGGVRGDESS